jgi:hypothetical protein
VGKGSQKDVTGDVAGADARAVPEQVSVALSEIAVDVREGLLALAVGAGLQVMTAMMDADVTALAGQKGHHDPDRIAVRHGRGDGSVTLGGRRVPVAARGCARSMAPTSCRCPPTRRSPAPRCSGRWRWSGCWPGWPPAATASGWSRSVSRSRPPARRRRSPRCHASSSRPPGAANHEASSGVHLRSPVRSSPGPTPPDGTGATSASSLSFAPPTGRTHQAHVKAGTDLEH